MTRQEFSQKIADYRKQSGLTMKEICFKLSCLPGDVYRIERGTYGYNLQKCLSYLDALNLELIINISKKKVRITDYGKLVEAISHLRAENCSLRAFAEAIKGSYVAVSNFENQKTIIKIDTLLKYADALDFTLDVTPKK